MQQLQNALANALAADKAKNYFLSSMSHEIRTPLNAVIGFTDLLKDSDLDENTRIEYLDSVSESSHALLTLLNDILELSKLTSGKVLSHPVHTDMNTFISGMNVMFGTAAAKKNLILRVKMEDVPELYLDQPKLRQVLFNLVGNAIKFTKNGGVTISVSFEKNGEDYGILVIKVADTGIGIPVEDREKMFEPFIQMSRMRGTNASGNGTGLGLAIVKKIVEQEGGKLTLESEIGKGSTFTVFWPNVHLHPVVDTEIANGSTDADTSKNSGTKEDAAMPKVLIVDDSDIDLNILSRMLKWLHVPHSLANSGQEALSLFENESFDIAMIDLIMPEMSGAELAEKIRKISRCTKMKVVAMSTENESIMYDKKLFDKVILKPITRDALYNRILEENEK